MFTLDLEIAKEIRVERSKFVIFYSLAADYDYVYVNAGSLTEASAVADAFSREFGAVIVGICPEYLLNVCHHE